MWGELSDFVLVLSAFVEEQDTLLTCLYWLLARLLLLPNPGNMVNSQMF